jgi:uncharacterized membrane protein (DUF4010 family)
MNVFELLLFLLFCAVVGFLGYLISPRYGWFAAAAVAAPVLALSLVGSFQEMLREIRRGWKSRGRHSD